MTKHNYLPDAAMIDDSSNILIPLTTYLYCEGLPQLDIVNIIKDLSQYFPDVKHQGPEIHDDREVYNIKYPNFTESHMASTSITIYKPINNKEQFPMDEINLVIQQSPEVDDIKKRLKKCTHLISLVDFIPDLPHKIRFDCYQKSLVALLKYLPNCKLVHWVHSQCFVDPKEYQSVAQNDDGILYGAVNVRLFNIPDTENTIADTLGLSVLGLPDFQCHYFNNRLNSDLVIDTLYIYSRYLFENGDVLNTGNMVSIEGLEDSSWECRREISIIGPERVVIDLDPGPDFSPAER